MDLTLDQFAKACGADLAVAATYFDAAVAAMARFRISETPVQVAAFCATLSVETTRLTQMEEDLFYRDPERLCVLFRRVFDLNGDKKVSPDEIAYAQQYVRNPKGLSMRLYNGYHGRGGMQLTWERNYAAQTLKLGFDYLGNPNLVKEPMHAMLTAASFWDDIQGNKVAHDMDEVTRRVNGPARLHLAERIAQRNIAMAVLV